MPFGYDLVAALKPSVLVELGTEAGLSFFCFCQSMVEHNIDGVCYAVDNWEGDEHTGCYGEEVYKAVSGHARDHYPEVARLMRIQFKDALDHFHDESIDLLHIDGFHTYEAVSKDFHTWYPKVQAGGIILIHDIHVRMKDFGVWKLWEEESCRFESFEFIHGFGLGVIRKPGGPDRDQPIFELMFSGGPQQHQQFRTLYFCLADYTMSKRELMHSKDNGGSVQNAERAVREVSEKAAPPDEATPRKVA